MKKKVFILLMMGASLDCASWSRYRLNKRKVSDVLENITHYKTQYVFDEDTQKKITLIDQDSIEQIKTCEFNMLDDVEQKIQCFELALKKDKKNFLAWYALGVCKESQLKWNDAQTFYQNSIALAPLFLLPHLAIAHTLIHKDKNFKVYDYLDNLFKMHPKNPWILSSLGYYSALDGRLEDARKYAIEALEQNERHAEAMLVLGMIYRRKKMFELSDMALSQALDVDIFLERAMAEKALLLFEQERYVDSIFWFEKALALYPNDASLLNNLSIAKIAVGGSVDAVAYAQKAIQLSDHEAEYYISLGNAYKANQNFQEAKEAYLKAKTFNPSLSQSYYNLGILLIDNEFKDLNLIERYENAIEYLTTYESMQKNTQDYEEISKKVQVLRTRATKAIETHQKRLAREKAKAEKEAAEKAAESKK